MTNPLRVVVLICVLVKCTVTSFVNIIVALVAKESKKQGRVPKKATQYEVKRRRDNTIGGTVN